MDKFLNKRYDFVLLFDVKDGNPNGDPDAGNLPRIDAESGHGLITDVCIKRKIRNYVNISKGDEPPYSIFIKEKAILNNAIDQAYKAIGINLEEPPKEGGKREKKGRGQGEEVDKAREFMCNNFYDIRTFGAVLAIGANAGQVRGPVQLTFARSIDPIATFDHSITRMAVTTEAEAEKQGGGNRTMGRKYTVPYGLYKAYGFVSSHLAEQTGFDKEDLNLLWEALNHMFEHDRSAARGLMGTRKLILFEHSSALGDTQAQTLFDSVVINRKDLSVSPRDFSDYEVTINRANIPDSVKLIEW